MELYTKSSPKGQEETGAYEVGVQTPWIHELPDALISLIYEKHNQDNKNKNQKLRM